MNKKTNQRRRFLPLILYVGCIRMGDVLTFSFEKVSKKKTYFSFRKEKVGKRKPNKFIFDKKVKLSKEKIKQAYV